MDYTDIRVPHRTQVQGEGMALRRYLNQKLENPQGTESAIFCFSVTLGSHGLSFLLLSVPLFQFSLSLQIAFFRFSLPNSHPSTQVYTFSGQVTHGNSPCPRSQVPGSQDNKSSLTQLGSSTTLTLSIPAKWTYTNTYWEPFHRVNWARQGRFSDSGSLRARQQSSQIPRMCYYPVWTESHFFFCHYYYSVPLTC